jgi:hypothetical protein
MNASQIAEVSGNGLPRKARKTQRSCGECGSFRKRCRRFWNSCQIATELRLTGDAKADLIPAVAGATDRHDKQKEFTMSRKTTYVVTLIETDEIVRRVSATCRRTAINAAKFGDEFGSRGYASHLYLLETLSQWERRAKCGGAE